MTEKEKIIYKHTELAKEYSSLMKSSNLLTAQEWEEINKRMNEILVEIQKLKDIEQTWEEFENKEIAPIAPKMMSIEEVAKECKCSRQQISMLREVGVIRAIRTGKSYMIPVNEFDRFLRDYIGYDVSSREKAIKAYREVENDRLGNHT